MKTIKFRHGKAALASAFAVGLIVASTPLAQSEEETTTEQSAVETTTEQSAVDISEVETSTEQSTAARSAVATPSELVQSSPVTVVETAQDGKTSKQTSEAAPSKAAASEASGAPATATEPAPSATAKPGTASADATAQERSAAVGPQADFKLETVQVKDGVATVKVSGTITDDTGLNKPMESLMLHKRGNKAQVSEVVSATYGGEEAFGDVFDFQPKELKDTFGLSDEDAQFPQILRISLEPTQDGDAKESLVGKKFSATYKVPVKDKGAQWVLLATDASILPDPVSAGPNSGAIPVGRVPAKFYKKHNNTPAKAPDPNGYNFPSNPQKFETRIHDKAYEILDGDAAGPNKTVLPKLGVKQRALGFAPYPGYYRDAAVKAKVNHYGWCAVEYNRKLSYDDYLQNSDSAWGIRYDANRQSTSAASGARCAYDTPPEQGRFFSQEHIARIEQNNQNNVHRSEEFTIGGNDGGVWYGGYFGVLAGKYRLTQSRQSEDAIRIQLGDLMDTKDWYFYDKQFASGSTPSYVLTPVPVDDPNLDFGVLITQGQGALSNGLGIRFLSASGARGFIRGDDSALGNLEESYRGINLDPNTPIKISFKTIENSATNSAGKSSTFDQGYFQPLWGPFDAPSDLTVKKEKLTDSGTNEFTYKIIVNNEGDGSSRKPVDREFKLFDSPEFKQGITITKRTLVSIDGAQVTDNTGQAYQFGALENGKGYPVPNESGTFTQEIAANTSKTYVVKVTVNPDSISGSPSELQCSNPLSSGKGAYNKARIEYGNNKVAEDDACINIEKPLPPLPPRVKKTVLNNRIYGPLSDKAGNQFRRIIYDIDVENEKKNAQDTGTYIDRELTIHDELGISDKVDVLRVQAIDSQTNATIADSDQTKSILENRSIVLEHGSKTGKVVVPANGTVSFRIMVDFRIKGTQDSANSGSTYECGTQFQANHGGYNKVVVGKDGAGSTEDLTSAACIDLPKPPTVTKSVKTDGKKEAVDTGDHLEVEYTVFVSNPAEGVSLTGLVVKDRPQFAQEAKNVQYFVKEGDRSQYSRTPRSLNGGELKLAEISMLAPGQSKTYFVKAVFDKPAYAEQVSATLTCDPQQGAGHGLFNEASLTLGGKELAKASDCANIPEPKKPTTGLVLQKEDTDNNPIPLDKGWQFAIYKANDQWQPQGQAIQFVNEDSAKNHRSTAADALTLGKYVLVETTAPQGYQLLAQPVKLEVYLDGADIKVKQPDGVNNAAARVENPNIVKVADVTTGDMPKAGGKGVFWMLLAGLGLLGAAWFFNRKRQN